MKEFTTEENVLFGKFLQEIFNEGLSYSYSKMAYLEIFKNKLLTQKKLEILLKKH